MNARDELAGIVGDYHVWSGDEGCKGKEAAADAILAAGYRKPRTITTAEELDALPVGSVILDVEHDAWQKMASGVWWCADQVNGAPTGYFPATVLHEGGAA